MLLLNNNPNNNLIVVNGGCGLGKSYTYTNIISSGKSLQNYVICLPTNKAKRHIYYNEFWTKTSRYLPLMTPDLDEIQDKEIIHLMEIGAFEQIKKYAENYILEHKDSNEFKTPVKLMQDYLEINEKVKDYTNDILTTHSRSFYLTDKVRDSHIFLYDEDILNEAIKIIQVPIKNILKTLPNLKKSKEIIKEKLKLAMDSEYKKIIPVESVFWYQDEIEKEIKDSKNIYCNINHLLRCSAIARDNPLLSKTLKNKNGYDEDDILFLLIENPLHNRKSIVLSATASKELYIDYFEKKYKRNLKLYEAPKVANSGKLIQHYSHTYSKQCLYNNLEILQDIRRNYNKTLIIMPKELIDKDRKANGLELELGNLSGLDELNGKNFIIVGLPNRSEIYHKMLEYAIYGEIHNEAKIVYSWEENDFGKFKFATYQKKYKNLRKIRDWECYDTLMQTVGRARLYIPENYNTTVEVFAKYPLERCNLCTLKIFGFFLEKCFI